MRQLRLSLRRPVSYARRDLCQGPSNAQAIAALDAWPAWHGGCLVLVGTIRAERVAGLSGPGIPQASPPR